MWPTTAQFDQAMTQESMVAVFKADLYRAGLTELLVPDLSVVGGSITADRTAAVRRTCTVQITDDARQLIPIFTGTNRFDPGPLEIIIYRGLKFPNGQQELIPQGVFRVSQAEVTDEGQPTLSITGYDRSRTVARAKLTTTYFIANGVSYLTAAANLIDFRLPFDVPVVKVVESVQPTTTRNTLVYQEQDDPWQRVSELVAAVGCESFFDLDGSWRARDIPDPTIDQPIFEFIDGVTSIMLSVKHVLDDEPGTNGIVLTSDSSNNTATIPRAMVVDSDPASPTYWFGPYGQVPDFVSDPTVGTNAEALVAATARLRSNIGRTETMLLACVPHPALDVSDVVRLRRGPSGIDASVLIETLTMPLDVATAMTMSCRARRTA